jgi:hypothetical protein
MNDGRMRFFAYLWTVANVRGVGIVWDCMGLYPFFAVVTSVVFGK